MVKALVNSYNPLTQTQLTVGPILMALQSRYSAQLPPWNDLTSADHPTWATIAKIRTILMTILSRASIGDDRVSYKGFKALNTLYSSINIYKEVYFFPIRPRNSFIIVCAKQRK